MMTCGFLIQLVFCQKKTMWFIGVEVEQETSAPPPKKNPGSVPASGADEDKNMAKIFIEMNVKRDVSKCFTGTIISNCQE